MTARNFKQSLSLTLAHEGGYVNHPRDPGGPTNKGITQRVYDDYRRLRGRVIRSVREIEIVEIEAIYREQYWKLIRGDSLPAGLDYAVFDFAVNSGPSRAIRYLQRLVKVDDDAVFGNGTLTAVYAAATANEEALILAYNANRLSFVRSLATFDTFGVGWTRRIVGMKNGFQANDNGVLDYAIEMARKDQAFVMPSPIGTIAGEVPAKAIAPPEDKDVFPTMPISEIVGMAAFNDQLAIKIALMALQ